MPDTPTLKLDRDGLHRFISEVWPAQQDAYDPARYEALRPFFCRYRYPVTGDDLRPGATVSGPTMMRLADIASYSLILAHLGDAALAVTTGLSIDFLRRPVGPTLVCDAELVKLGRSLAVSRITIGSAEDGSEPNLAEPEAIANVTYSLSLLR